MLSGTISVNGLAKVEWHAYNEGPVGDEPIDGLYTYRVHVVGSTETLEKYDYEFNVTHIRHEGLARLNAIILFALSDIMEESA